MTARSKMPQGLTTITEQLTYCIGALSIQWSACETTFLHILAALLRYPDDRTLVIWFSIKNNRARLELIAQLSRADAQIPKELRSEIKACVLAFRSATNTRNFYCHANYRGTKPLSETIEVIEGGHFTEEHIESPVGIRTKKASMGTVNEICTTIDALTELQPRAIKLLRELEAKLPVRRSGRPG